MTEEIEVAGPPPAVAPSEMEMSWRLAQRIAKTEFVPQSFRNRPDAVLAAVLTGREIGIGPMQSLQSINVIQGKPTLAPELMRALVFRAGHRIDVLEHSETACKMHGVRSDSGAEASVTWTTEDAKRANLAGKGAWVTYPRAMLLARATSELCRLLFPDVIAGCSYTAEEIGGEIETPGAIRVDPETGEIESPAEVVLADDEIADAELVEPGTPAGVPAGDVAPYVPDGGRQATDKQRFRIENEIEAKGMPAGWDWWPLPDDLTMKDASWLIDELDKMAKPPTERRGTMRDDGGTEPAADAA